LRLAVFPIEALYQEWRALKKLKNRKKIAEKKKRSEYVDNLDNIFDLLIC